MAFCYIAFYVIFFIFNFPINIKNKISQTDNFRFCSKLQNLISFFLLQKSNSVHNGITFLNCNVLTCDTHATPTHRGLTLAGSQPSLCFWQHWKIAASAGCELSNLIQNVLAMKFMCTWATLSTLIHTTHNPTM